MYSNIIPGPFTNLTVKRAPRFKLPELETFILKLLLYIGAYFLKEKSLSGKQVLTLVRFKVWVPKVLIKFNINGIRRRYRLAN